MLFVFSYLTDSWADNVLVECSFPMADGQGTISKAALAQVPAGAQHVASSDWVRKIGGGGSGTCVELTAVVTNSSSVASASPFNGPATFQ